MSEPAKPRVTRNSVSWKSKYENALLTIQALNEITAKDEARIERLRSEIRQLQLEAREQRQRGYREAVLALTDHLAEPAPTPTFHGQPIEGENATAHQEWLARETTTANERPQTDAE